MKLAERTQQLPERRAGELKKHDSLRQHPKGIAAATCKNKIIDCCCCNGLACYLLNQHGVRPFYRTYLLQNVMEQQKNRKWRSHTKSK